MRLNNMWRIRYPHYKNIILTGYSGTEGEDMLTFEIYQNLYNFITDGGNVFAICDSVQQMIPNDIKIKKRRLISGFFSEPFSFSYKNLVKDVNLFAFCEDYRPGRSGFFPKFRTLYSSAQDFETTVFYNGGHSMVFEENADNISLFDIIPNVGSDREHHIMENGKPFSDIARFRIGRGNLICSCSHIECPVDYVINGVKLSAEYNKENKTAYHQAIASGWNYKKMLAHLNMDYEKFIKQSEPANEIIRQYIYENIMGIKR
jgi:hypothetical protein